MGRIRYFHDYALYKIYIYIYRWWENLRLSTEIVVYLGNGAI